VGFLVFHPGANLLIVIFIPKYILTKQLYSSILSMKKLLLTMFAIFLSVTPLVLAESYSTELQSAYSYAYDISITTQPTIDTANMYGFLIRAHMAKMMVNYAEVVLGLSPNE
jgi:hypothetical protein